MTYLTPGDQEAMVEEENAGRLLTFVNTSGWPQTDGRYG